MSVIYRKLHRVYSRSYIDYLQCMVLAFCFTNFVFKIFYIPSLLCDGIFMLCLNDSLFFLKPIVVSQKEKKRGGGGGGGGGPMLGL